MIDIDHEILIQYAELFSERVLKGSRYLDSQFQDQTTYDFRSGIDFHEGFIMMEEGYKNVATQKQKQYLSPSLWNDGSIENGTVAEEISALINDYELHNLIDWHDREKFEELLEDHEKKYQLGDCFRQIFCGENDKESFQNAQNLIGDRFPIISFLFFIKNPEKYLPVRPNAFKTKFQTVGIIGWQNRCSWDNYRDFISAIEEVQIFLMEYYHDDTITLIDAHSFVWMAWMITESEEEFLIDVEKHFKEESKKKRKELSTPKGREKEVERIESELSSLKGAVREAVVKLRVNQGVFRNMLLDMYDHCCLCQVRNRRLLTASHIKPWAASTSAEKLDRNNGFLMCPNHDRLFDKGFISFSDDGSIMISSNLSENDRILTNVHPDMSIKLKEGNKCYLQYHRNHVFKFD